MAAPDITYDFISRLKANGKIAEGFFDPAWYQYLAIGGPASALLDALYAFKEKVQARGPWDFKAHKSPLGYKDYEKTGVHIAGKDYRYDMPGNFHYGFTGAAAGIREWVLFWQAGKAQQAAGTSKPEYHCTWGDDPEDYEFIRLGYKLYEDVELEVTSAHLAHVLSFFQRIACSP